MRSAALLPLPRYFPSWTGWEGGHLGHEAPGEEENEERDSPEAGAPSRLLEERAHARGRQPAFRHQIASQGKECQEQQRQQRQTQGAASRPGHRQNPAYTSYPRGPPVLVERVAPA